MFILVDFLTSADVRVGRGATYFNDFSAKGITYTYIYIYIFIHEKTHTVNHMMVQTDSFEEDFQRLEGLRGPWLPIDCLQSGVVVKAFQPILSADKMPVQLHLGVKGIVQKIDKDGDAVLTFPEMMRRGILKDITIFKSDFGCLRVLKT